MPHQPYYETFYDGLAAMVRSVAANHALDDGNKRLAVTVLHSTLLVNGYAYVRDNEDAVAVALRCASGETDFAWLSEFIECWTGRLSIRVPMETGAIQAAMEGLQEGVGDAVGKTGAKGEFFVETIRAHASGRLDPDIVRQHLASKRTNPLTSTPGFPPPTRGAP